MDGISPCSLLLPRCLCLSVAYVCKNCHTMTLIRGFGTPLTPLLSRPRDLMEAIYLLSLSRHFITRIYSSEQRRQEGNIAFGTAISSVAWVKIAQALRLCQRVSLPPLLETGEVNIKYAGLSELDLPCVRHRRVRAS